MGNWFVVARRCETEHRRSQKFRLGAAQNQNVQSLGLMLKYGAIAYWSLGKDFQALEIIMFELHLL